MDDLNDEVVLILVLKKTLTDLQNFIIYMENIAEKKSLYDSTGNVKVK